MKISELQKAAHKLSLRKGWWDDCRIYPGLKNYALAPEFVDNHVPEKLALIHSEISEALESVRSGEALFFETKDGKPEGLGVELADAVIRIADLCEAVGVDLESCILLKHRYNKGRPHKHGGKRF